MGGGPSQPIECRARLETERDRTLARQVDDFLQATSACAFGDQHSLEWPAGAQRLDDGVNPGQNHSSGFSSRPLLKRLVKLAIAAASVISTTCSELKCSARGPRVSAASAVRVSSLEY